MPLPKARYPSLASGDHELHAPELERDRSVFMSDPGLKDLSIKADRRSLLACVNPNEDRLGLARLAPVIEAGY
jgi:hypothetical protein